MICLVTDRINMERVYLVAGANGSVGSKLLKHKIVAKTFLYLSESHIFLQFNFSPNLMRFTSQKTSFSTKYLKLNYSTVYSLISYLSMTETRHIGFVCPTTADPFNPYRYRVIQFATKKYTLSMLILSVTRQIKILIIW